MNNRERTGKGFNAISKDNFKGKNVEVKLHFLRIENLEISASNLFQGNSKDNL